MKAITARIASALTKQGSANAHTESLSVDSITLAYGVIGWVKNPTICIKDTEDGCKLRIHTDNFKLHPLRIDYINFKDADITLSSEAIVETVENYLELMGLRVRMIEHYIDMKHEEMLVETCHDEDTNKDYTEVEWLDHAIKEKLYDKLDYSKLHAMYQSLPEIEHDDNKVAALVNFFEDNYYDVDKTHNTVWSKVDIVQLSQAFNKFFKYANIDQSVSTGDVTYALLSLSTSEDGANIYVEPGIFLLPTGFFELIECSIRLKIAKK